MAPRDGAETFRRDVTFVASRAPIVAHPRAADRHAEKSAVHQHREDAMTHELGHPEETRGLRQCQAQPRHLFEFPLNSAEQPFAVGVFAAIRRNPDLNLVAL
jgi:hypothetical protein